MKNLSLLVLALALYLPSFSQNIEGAWKWTGQDDDGNDIMAIAIFSDGFQVATWYDLENKNFISTNGGTWTFADGTVTETVEFDTKDSTRVGQNVSFQVALEGEKATLVESGDVWTRIDSGSPGALNGAWLISGRMRDGEINERSTDRPRKTMKIMSGTRFQWIAYNTATKQFMGTGGGTYTTIDGKYTENIEFFSRDGSRVGASLEFDFDIKEGKWHHSGKSSKGDPMYEVWSPRTK